MLQLGYYLKFKLYKQRIPKLFDREDKVNFDRKHLTRKDISREQAAFKECAKVSMYYLAKVNVIVSAGPTLF